MFWLLLFVIFLFAIWAIAEKKLSPPDLRHFDKEVSERFTAHPSDSEHTEKIMQIVTDVRSRARATKSLKGGLAIVREFADNLSDELESDCEFKPVIANGVPCEWAIAPGADPKRRVLMLHGGAFIFGSPQGHRYLAHHYSHVAKAAVLSVDYRMLPENKRLDSVSDAQSVYHWLLTQGPDGATELDKLVLAGDSAGGNLALMLANWSRVGAARQADAVVCIAPSTDSTLDSPTVKANLKTDKMLGEAFTLLTKIPKPLNHWVSLFLMRTSPINPLISPLFDDLHDLPPTLIQASSTECLLGEAIRFTNKANAAGSDVKLQVWEDQLHDWHIMTPESDTSKQAWEKIETFLKEAL